jgi:hypothetical protein
VNSGRQAGGRAAVRQVEPQETLAPSGSTDAITGGTLSFVSAASPSAAAIWPVRCAWRSISLGVADRAHRPETVLRRVRIVVGAGTCRLALIAR